MSEYFFAVGTIGLSKQKAKPVGLLAAARHNKRELKAEFGEDGKFESTVKVNNKILAGPPTANEVVQLAKLLMVAAGIDTNRLRKDYTQAIELIFSLPVEAKIESEPYFVACVDWTRKTFGHDVVLSADIHNDESTPHCHVLVLPLREGKRVGGALINRTALRELTEAFFSQVAQPNGLKRPPRRLSGHSKKKAARLIFEKLEKLDDPLLKSRLLDPLKSEIARNPDEYMSLLSIDHEDVRPKNQKSFVSIMISKGKGPTFDPDTNPSWKNCKPETSPIGFNNMVQLHQNLSCVGVEGSSTKTV